MVLLDISFGDVQDFVFHPFRVLCTSLSPLRSWER